MQIQSGATWSYIKITPFTHCQDHEKQKKRIKIGLTGMKNVSQQVS